MKDKSITNGNFDDLYLSVEKRTINIRGSIPTNKDNYPVFEDQKGYIKETDSDDDDYIWIFSAQGRPKYSNVYPYFWYNEDGELEFSEPSDTVKEKFSEKRIVNMTLVDIINQTDPNEELFDEQAINDMNAASDSYTPDIYPKDDFLKQTIKEVIKKKKINLNKLKSKTDEKYQILNMVSALKGETKMSVSYFIKWLNLLKCDFQITVTDNGEDLQDPLPFPVMYHSYSDAVGEFRHDTFYPEVKVKANEETSES